MAGFPEFLGVSTLSAAQGVFLRRVLLLELGMMHSAMVCSTSKPHPSGCLLRSARSNCSCLSLFLGPGQQGDFIGLTKLENRFWNDRIGL